MEPSTDPEREMVRLVDERARAGDLSAVSVADIAPSLSFELTEQQAQFLVRYIIWRMDHPLSEPTSGTA